MPAKKVYYACGAAILRARIAIVEIATWDGVPRLERSIVCDECLARARMTLRPRAVVTPGESHDLGTPIRLTVRWPSGATDPG
jgi:hypothetical protein